MSCEHNDEKSAPSRGIARSNERVLDIYEGLLHAKDDGLAFQPDDREVFLRAAEATIGTTLVPSNEDHIHDGSNDLPSTNLETVDIKTIKSVLEAQNDQLKDQLAFVQDQLSSLHGFVEHLANSENLANSEHSVAGSSNRTGSGSRSSRKSRGHVVRTSKPSRNIRSDSYVWRRKSSRLTVPSEIEIASAEDVTRNGSAAAEELSSDEDEDDDSTNSMDTTTSMATSARSNLSIGSRKSYANSNASRVSTHSQMVGFRRQSISGVSSTKELLRRSSGDNCQENGAIISSVARSVRSISRVNNEMLTDADGNRGRYTGSILRESGLPHGFGLIEYNDTSYNGDWIVGRWYGQGQLYYQNSDFYEGGFKANHRHGQGVIKFADGRKFEGAFIDGTMVSGKMTYGDGSFYSGDWFDELRHGFGRFVFKDQSVYEGEFRRGVFSGWGKMSWNDGSWYEGQWSDGIAASSERNPPEQMSYLTDALVSQKQHFRPPTSSDVNQHLPIQLGCSIERETSYESTPEAIDDEDSQITSLNEGKSISSDNYSTSLTNVNDVFLIHTGAQKADQVYTLKYVLEQNGYSCFLDEKMKKFVHPNKTMQAQLEQCRHSVVVVSKEFLCSPNPCAELIYAFRRLQWLRQHQGGWHSLWVILYEMNVKDYKVAYRASNRKLPPLHHELQLYEYRKQEKRYESWISCCEKFSTDILDYENGISAKKNWESFLDSSPLPQGFPQAQNIYEVAPEETGCVPKDFFLGDNYAKHVNNDGDASRRSSKSRRAKKSSKKKRKKKTKKISTKDCEESSQASSSASRKSKVK